MRADRLLSLLLLLQSRGRMTAQELAQRLEVSERTIYRDLNALSAAGVPVYAERGPGGGCALMDHYRTNLTGLSPAEVRTLFLSGTPGPLADLGFGSALEAALLKLLAALPSSHRHDVEQARQRVYVDAAGWSHPEEAPHLGVIQEAVWQERKLRLTYRKGSGELSERVVDPLGLVAKAGVWYLVACVDAEMRTFRISRVQAAELTEEPCQRPDGFDLAAHWTASSAQFRASWAQYPVTLRVAVRSTAALCEVFGAGMRALLARAEPPDAMGRTTVTLQLESFDTALTRVLAAGTLAEVVEPPELRQAIVDLARQVSAFYAQQPVTS
jgi:predicted DNA-binding transcriptional regulator YafY